jgi:uncharacterized protein
VSKRLPNREQAIQLLKEHHCSPKVISHSLAVTALAIEIGGKLKKKGIEVDLGLVEAGALLHDIGRSKTHQVDHSLLGAQIARTIELPQPVVNIIKRHVGAGITEEEAQCLGWPQDTYMPQTIEEKVVCYADKRIDCNKPTSIETEIQHLQKQGRSEAAERVRKLHNEITHLLGETP